MYQSLTVVGRLGRDPEMKFLPSGDPVCAFSIATDRAYTDRSGQKQKETTWFRVTVFGKQAETANQFLSKGKLVLVEGRLVVDAATGGPRVFTGKDGVAKAALEIAANNVRFLSPADEQSTAPAAAAPKARPGAAPARSDDDVPF